MGEHRPRGPISHILNKRQVWNCTSIALSLFASAVSEALPLGYVCGGVRWIGYGGMMGVVLAMRARACTLPPILN